MSDRGLAIVLWIVFLVIGVVLAHFDRNERGI